MKDVEQRDWDDIDAETERIWAKPRQTKQERAREAWEKLFTRKPIQDKDLN